MGGGTTMGAPSSGKNILFNKPMHTLLFLDMQTHKETHAEQVAGKSAQKHTAGFFFVFCLLNSTQREEKKTKHRSKSNRGLKLKDWSLHTPSYS